MTTVSEIAPDLFRISTFVKEFDLQFNQFLVRDDEPLLFHTGPRAMFAAGRDAVATLLNPATVKWIGAFVEVSMALSGRRSCSEAISLV